MFGKVFVIVATILLVQCASGRVIREAEKPAASDVSLQDIFDQISEGIKNLKKIGLDTVGAKDEEELKTILTTKAKAYVEKIDETARSLQVKTKDAVTDLENNELVKDVRTRINTAVENFKKEQPGITESADQLKTRFESTVNEIVGEAKKLQDSPQTAELQNHLKELTSNILKVTSEAINDVNSKINAEKKD